MNSVLRHILAGAVIAGLPCGALGASRPAPPASQPAVIPVEYDAFRMWDNWAYLRMNQRAYMTSTYDRTGGNEAADASHFLYQLADDRNVSLDVAGPGVLVFARYNHWHGSPWHYIVDGREHVVKETSTADPTKPVPNSVFVPEAAFPTPLTFTWSQTKGADLSWVPIPFERWFTMAYERTHYGTGYYIYQKYAPGTRLTRELRSWSPEVKPPEDVLELIGRAGSDLAPSDADFQEGDIPPQPDGNKITLLSRPNLAATIRSLTLTVKEEDAATLGEARIQMFWDGATSPAVDAPLKLFFGTGSLYNRENREFLVKAFPVSVQFKNGRVRFSTFFPMPFLKSANVLLTPAPGKPLPAFSFRVKWMPYKEPSNWVGHFHATYVDHGTPEPGRDLIFLDTTKVEGGGDWCGHFVGTSFIFSDRAVLTTLEGDPRFYFDDNNTPQAQGTGTEEWGGGGDYWGGRTMTLPFAGHPVGARSAKEADNDADLVNSAYRFLLSDLMPFGRNARITFEHGGENRSTEHYQSVTFWYGRHEACLKPTDTLHVGDEADEAKHAYASPTASPVQTLTSRYEWGIDHLEGKELYPESTDTGRFMTGTSTFRLALDPKNVGVLLRRKFDYQFPNQCARVFVAEDRPDAPWQEAGTWYTAGSNRVVYSNPKDELGATQHVVQVSNRRWRDDEFLLPVDLVVGRAAIRLKIEFTPRNIPLMPGDPLGQQAWSEYRYTAYCYVMPGQS